MRRVVSPIGRVFRRGGREVVTMSVVQLGEDRIIVDLSVHDAGAAQVDGTKPIGNRRSGITFDLSEVEKLIPQLQKSLDIGHTLASPVGSRKREGRANKCRKR